MCGIFGIWQWSGDGIDCCAVNAATTSLRHRGPDDEGYLLVESRAKRAVLCAGLDTNPVLQLQPIQSFNTDSFDLAFGFRRLAILDLSPAGHQPMSSADGRYWIIFNGEIYNYIELRAELSSCGHRFHTGTDTEVILAAYRQWGKDCVARFNGMWALAIWDCEERSLFIVRDRFGVKPLFYRAKSTSLAFASEIKALVGRHGIPFVPNDEVLYPYLVGGLLPNPQAGDTFFRGIRSLPPGHWMYLRNGKMHIERYWYLQTAPASDPIAPSRIVEQYGELFMDSVRLRLRADVPIGTCLSGGVDSSSIVGVVNKLMLQGGLTTDQIGAQQKTFSAIYETMGRYNEQRYIDLVLKATAAEGNATFPSAERLWNDIERLVWHQDEPFQSTSIFAQWCVMSAVRDRGVTVLLDGQGADEVLAGYRPFSIYLGELIRRLRVVQVLEEILSIKAHSTVSLPETVFNSLFYPLPAALVQQLRRQRDKRRRYGVELDQDFLARSARETPVDWQPWAEQDTLEKHLSNLVHESSLPHLLRYEDRNSMAFGIEARVPFLDYRLVEFSFQRAAHLRIKRGWTKWVLRQAMQGIVPDSIIWRTDKVGFETPEHDWTNQWIAAHPRFFSNNSLSRPYLNIDFVNRALSNFSKAGGDVRQIWRWINLEIWLDVWNKA